MAEIKAGDVVELKSGSPTMTVNFVDKGEDHRAAMRSSASRLSYIS
jgi:hypothetical protein